ncbi:hypothetical protein O9929_16205 [Vibrio lentus]|nr:hypothetical protein [Vibrio lentus]
MLYFAAGGTTLAGQWKGHSHHCPVGFSALGGALASVARNSKGTQHHIKYIGWLKNR